MKRKWTKEEINAWYEKRTWLCGCNYVPTPTPGMSYWFADTHEKVLPYVKKELAIASDIGMNTVRMFIPFEPWYYDRDGLLERTETLLAILDGYGISLMPMLFNDCVPFIDAENLQIDPNTGYEEWDVGYHSGHAENPFGGQSEKGAILWDKAEFAPKCEQYLTDVVGAFAHDRRIAVWDIWNEPGNSNRWETSLPYIKRTFALCREQNPDAPLTACVWRYPAGWFNGKEELDEIQKYVLSESDIISFHQYGKPESVKKTVEILKKSERPLINTEWLHRLWGNFVEEQLPYYKEEKIGCYCWGLVAGHSQTYLPWDGLKKNKNLDFTLWQHDLFRGNGKPYDPDEIEVFKKLTGKK